MNVEEKAETMEIKKGGRNGLRTVLVVLAILLLVVSGAQAYQISQLAVPTTGNVAGGQITQAIQPAPQAAAPQMVGGC